MKLSYGQYGDWMTSIRCGFFSGIIVFFICYIFFLFSKDGKVAFEDALSVAVQVFFYISIVVRSLIWYDRKLGY